MANPKGNPNPNWVKGVSGNPKGRTPGTKNAFTKSRILIEAQRDLARAKVLYRAIINGDLETLKQFNMTKVTNSNKLEAQKQLRAMAKEEIAIETALLQERAAEKAARALAAEEAARVEKAKQTPGSLYCSSTGATFNANPSVSVIKSAMNG